MRTHIICFCREIRKILCGYPLLSVAMTVCLGPDTAMMHTVNRYYFSLTHLDTAITQGSNRLEKYLKMKGSLE